MAWKNLFARIVSAGLRFFNYVNAIVGMAWKNLFARIVSAGERFNNYVNANVGMCKGLLLQIVSSGLYLFDYISNIVVLWQYWNLLKTAKYSKTLEISQYYFGKDYLVTARKVPFYVCLGLLICDPVVAAVAFKLRLSPQEHPVRSAFFLPLVQFKRFVVGIWRTCSFTRYVTRMHMV
jgi:hypothetical protein